MRRPPRTERRAQSGGPTARHSSKYSALPFVGVNGGQCTGASGRMSKYAGNTALHPARSKRIISAMSPEQGIPAVETRQRLLHLAWRRSTRRLAAVLGAAFQIEEAAAQRRGTITDHSPLSTIHFERQAVIPDSSRTGEGSA